MALDNRILAAITAIGSDIKALFASEATKAPTTYVDNSINSLRNELRGGASAAIDTFKEVQDILAADETAAAALATAVGNRVRFDAPQTLTTAQKLVASQNIGVGDPEQDLLAAYVAAKS